MSYITTFRFPILLLFLVAHTAICAQEICNNGIDDDGDGLVDLNDAADCSCVSSGIVGLGLDDPGFEVQTCCPSAISENNCIENWIQATIATTDYLHDCDFLPAFVPTPLPDGNGCVGMFHVEGWQEYIGTCLPAAWPAGVPISLTAHVAGYAVNGAVDTAISWFGGSTDLTVFGFPTCPLFPIPTTDCPNSFGAVPLGSVTITPQPIWQMVQIDFTTAIDVVAIAIGSPCSVSPSFIWTDGFGPYLLMDGLAVAPQFPGPGDIAITGSLCEADLVLTATPDTASGDYQWYLDGVALVGRADTVLHASALGLGPGNYQFLVQGSTDCSLITINVGGPLPPDLQIGASFTTGCAPLLVNFSNSVPAGQLLSTIWQFGDGVSFDFHEPAHLYPVPGSYTVSATATGLNGCVAMDTVFVIVEECTGIADIHSLQPSLTVRQDGSFLFIGSETGWTECVMLDLFSADGRLVHRQVIGEQGLSSVRIDLSHFASGLHILRVSGTALCHAHRFIVP